MTVRLDRPGSEPHRQVDLVTGAEKRDALSLLLAGNTGIPAGRPLGMRAFISASDTSGASKSGFCITGLKLSLSGKLILATLLISPAEISSSAASDKIDAFEA